MTEREIAEKMIKDGKAMVEEAESKLAALDKPILKNWDYGKIGDVGYWIKVCSDVYWIDTCKEISYYPDSHFIPSKLGNLLGDLKRNSEDLRSFSRTKPCNKYSVHICDICDIDLRVENGFAAMDFDEATDFHQKFSQVLATAKRKQK